MNRGSAMFNDDWLRNSTGQGGVEPASYSNFAYTNYLLQINEG